MEKERVLVYLKASTRKALEEYKEETGVPMSQALERSFLEKVAKK